MSWIIHQVLTKFTKYWPCISLIGRVFFYHIVHESFVTCDACATSISLKFVFLELLLNALYVLLGV